MHHLTLWVDGRKCPADGSAQPVGYGGGGDICNGHAQRGIGCVHGYVQWADVVSSSLVAWSPFF